MTDKIDAPKSVDSVAPALCHSIPELRGRHSQRQMAPWLPRSPHLRKCQVSGCHWNSTEALVYRSQSIFYRNFKTAIWFPFMTCQPCCSKTSQMQTIISLFYLKNTFTLVERTNAASTKCHPSKQIFLAVSS